MVLLNQVKLVIQELLVSDFLVVLLNANDMDLDKLVSMELNQDFAEISQDVQLLQILSIMFVKILELREMALTVVVYFLVVLAKMENVFKNNLRKKIFFFHFLKN